MAVEDGKRYDITASGDGNPPSVQHHGDGSVALSGLDRPELHIGFPSFGEISGGIAQKEEHYAPNVEVGGSSPPTPPTLAVIAGSPIDFDCPLCEKPKGIPCKVRVREGQIVVEIDFHLDRKKLTRILPA